MRQDRIVPRAVEVGSLKPNGLHLDSAPLDAKRIVPSLEGRLDAPPRGSAGTANEADEHLAAQQGLSTPVRGDVATQARFDLCSMVLVPGGRWLTAIRRPVSSASRCSSAFQSRARALLLPPPSAVMSSSWARGYMADPIWRHPRPARRSCARGGIRVHAPADPTAVGADVVDAVGEGLASLLIDEVIHADLRRRPRGGPLTASMLDVSTACLLLGLASNDRLAAALNVLHPAVERREWRVAVRVMAPLAGLARSLEAVVRRMEPLAHELGADLVPRRVELGRERADPRARPAPR